MLPPSTRWSSSKVIAAEALALAPNAAIAATQIARMNFWVFDMLLICSLGCLVIGYLSFVPLTIVVT